MRAAAHPASAKIRVDFLEKRGVLEIRTLLPPIVKILGAVVRRNELMD